MKKLSNVLIKIFYTLLGIAPLATGIIMALVCLSFGWAWLFPGHDNLHYLIMERFGHIFGSLFVILITAGIGVGAYFLLDRLARDKKKQILIVCAGIAIVAFVPRMLLFIIYGGSLAPSSDSANIWQLVKGNLPDSVLGHYTFFPAYLHYGTFMKVIATVSGYRFSAVLLVNVFTNVITAVMIPIICHVIGMDLKMSSIAGIIYALYPPGIIYTLTATPEHQCIMFLELMICFVMLGLREENRSKGVVYFALAGVFAAASNAFKSFFPVVLVAIVIICILQIIEENFSLSQIGILIAAVCIVISTQVATYKGIEFITSHVFDVTIDDSDALPHFVVVGLNREGEGQIHLGNMSHYYTNLRENGVDADTAQDETFDLIISDWKSHPEEVIPFMVKKLIWAWQDDYAPVRVFAYASELPDSDGLNIIKGPVATAGQIIYILLLLADLGVVVYNLFKAKEYNLLAVLNDMIIYGFFWLTLIAEAQSRYKCLVLPCMCIMASRLMCYNRKGKE